MRHRTKEHLRHDTALRYAVLHALMIIAEAVRHTPKELMAPHPQIAWRDIVGLGVLIKHEYHKVDTDVIWSTVQDHLPQLRSAVKTMLTTIEATELQ